MRQPADALVVAATFVIALVAGGTHLRADEVAADETPLVRVGSKTFTESVVLGELIVQIAVSTGAETEYRSQLGGTQILWKALLSGEIDVYADYTGTITEEILKNNQLADIDAIREALAPFDVSMSAPLGFNNTYALGMKQSQLPEVHTISDLRQHPELSLRFSNEFMQRQDGWPHLRKVYRLPHTDVRGIDHDLAYNGIASGAIDVIDLYSTDAEIPYYDLRVLDDDLHAFPAYEAVILFRDDLQTRAPKVVDALKKLEVAISEEQMTAMNARAKLDRVPETQVAADFLEQQLGITVDVQIETRVQRLIRYTLEHLFLVCVSVTAAILLAVPLGIVAAKQPVLGQAVLAIVGMLQTVPSLALFVLLIPLLGLGTAPTICALFLYSLLPIVRNTHAGLHDIERPLLESAEALGLSPLARLRLVELPLASRSILAGIKTAAVINVGTATLGGLIGAGGYGEPIITGLRLDRNDLLLEGAIPAALMALMAQGFFDVSERWLVPRGLRLKTGH